jgi:hypothetical protein
MSRVPILHLAAELRVAEDGQSTAKGGLSRAPQRNREIVLTFS